MQNNFQPSIKRVVILWSNPHHVDNMLTSPYVIKSNNVDELCLLQDMMTSNQPTGLVNVVTVNPTDTRTILDCSVCSYMYPYVITISYSNGDVAAVYGYASEELAYNGVPNTDVRLNPSHVTYKTFDGYVEDVDITGDYSQEVFNNSPYDLVLNGDYVSYITDPDDDMCEHAENVFMGEDVLLPTRYNIPTMYSSALFDANMLNNSTQDMSYNQTSGLFKQNFISPFVSRIESMASDFRMGGVLLSTIINTYPTSISETDQSQIYRLESAVSTDPIRVAGEIYAKNIIMSLMGYHGIMQIIFRHSVDLFMRSPESKGCVCDTLVSFTPGLSKEQLQSVWNAFITDLSLTLFRELSDLGGAFDITVNANMGEHIMLDLQFRDMNTFHNRSTYDMRAQSVINPQIADSMTMSTNTVSASMLMAVGGTGY